MRQAAITAEPKTARRVSDDDLRILACQTVFGRIAGCGSILKAHHAEPRTEPEGSLTVFVHGPDSAQGIWQDVFTDAAHEAPILEAPRPVDPQLPGAILIDGAHVVCTGTGGVAIVGEGAVLEAE